MSTNVPTPPWEQSGNDFRNGFVVQVPMNGDLQYVSNLNGETDPLYRALVFTDRFSAEEVLAMWDGTGGPDQRGKVVKVKTWIVLAD